MPPSWRSSRVVFAPGLAKLGAMTALDVTDPKQLSKAVKALAKSCAVIKAAHARVGVPEWRTRQGDYAGLARIIAYQQLSTKAAATIWGRVEVLLGKVTPKASSLPTSTPCAPAASRGPRSRTSAPSRKPCRAAR